MSARRTLKPAPVRPELDELLAAAREGSAAMSEIVQAEGNPNGLAASFLNEKANEIEGYATVDLQHAAQLEFEVQEIRARAGRWMLKAQGLRAAALSLTAFNEAES